VASCSQSTVQERFISDSQPDALKEGAEDVPTLLVEQEGVSSRENVNDSGDELFADGDLSESFELETGGVKHAESDQILDAIRQQHGFPGDVHIDPPTNVINEYTTNTLMQSCFPTLFVDGRGGFHATTFEKQSPKKFLRENVTKQKTIFSIRMPVRKDPEHTLTIVL
jgi:hypothetical protein